MRWRILVPVIVGSASLLTGSLSASAALTRSAAVSASATAGAPLYAFNTGLVLTATGKLERGAVVRVEAYSGAAGQRWVFGSHDTIRPASDEKLCLNVPRARYRTGTILQVWNCVAAASEEFPASAPSAHTAVRFLRPVKATKYCLTAADESGARVGLDPCAALSTQAWSQSDLDGVAGTIGDEFGIQALHPATAGSAVTASDSFANQLDQFWTSTTSGSYVQLQPVEDTALCASLTAPEADGVTLDLAPCTATAPQLFTGIGLFFNANYTYSFLTTADSTYCVQAAATGSASARPMVLGSCVGNARDFWNASVNVITDRTDQFQELYAGNESGPDGLEFSMRAAGGAGSAVALSNDDDAAAQVWTDLAPGQTTATGNPDGSITLRPLSDESLCLTVPAGDYAAGVQLTVAACDGAVDQEFVRGLSTGSIDLLAAGAGEFCVTAADGIAAGSPVELEQCAEQDDQTWSTFFSWGNWAGVPPAGTAPAGDPGDALVLSGASSAGGQVGVLPSPGGPEWDASEDWTYIASPSGDEFQSFYDPGLCLDAPSAAVGTQLTAAPCNGSSDQLFFFGATDTANTRLWRLGVTGPCVAVGSTAGSAGLPLVLQACSASQADEAWLGPSYQL